MVYTLFLLKSPNKKVSLESIFLFTFSITFYPFAGIQFYQKSPKLIPFSKNIIRLLGNTNWIRVQLFRSKKSINPSFFMKIKWDTRI
jgi:hypothetical protein